MDTYKPENVCAICNKIFSRKADCTRHARLHAGIKPYLCEMTGCGKRFAQYTALKTHRNVHTGSKPYRCGATGCRSSFGDPSSCARHRREMHRPRDPFKCPVSGCKSSILRMSAFKAHLKKHGLDPEKHVTCKRGRSFTPVRRSIGPVEIKEERVSNLQVSSRNQEIHLPRLPDSLDHFFLYPGDHSTLMTQPGHPSGSGLSYSSSSLPAPSPRIAPACNAGYFLSLPRASSATSSQISMAPTPVLTPEEIGYTRNVGVQLEPAYQDWIPVWQGHGIQFVEQRRGVVGLDM